MNEYVGNKIDRSNGVIKITQPVLLQSFTDEFDLVRDHKITVPGVPGTVLSASKNKLSAEDLFKYHSGTGKLLHLMKWSRPEIGNAVCELSRFMSCAGAAHFKAMYRVMNYCLNTIELERCFVLVVSASPTILLVLSFSWKVTRTRITRRIQCSVAL